MQLPFFFGYPRLIDTQQLLQTIDEAIAVEGWHGQSGHGMVQTLHVAIRPEQSNTSFIIFVRFHTFETFNAIV